MAYRGQTKIGKKNAAYSTVTKRGIWSKQIKLNASAKLAFIQKGVSTDPHKIFLFLGS